MKNLTQRQKKLIANHWMSEILISSMEVGVGIPKELSTKDYSDIIQLVLDKAESLGVEGKRMGSLSQIVERIKSLNSKIEL